MKKFDVTITEMFQRTVTVDAINAEKAELAVSEYYENGYIEIKEIVDVQFRVKPAKENARVDLPR